LPKSGIGRALLYSISNEQNLKRYLADGICEIDNSPVENSIRPFTIGRKNWLFCDTPKGTRASAAAYSILETCVANGIDLEKYLNYVFARLPNEEWPQHETTLEKYLPWSPEIQKECK
jgi:transposase